MTEPNIKMEVIYGVMKFIPPVYKIWKRTWRGKWLVITETEDPTAWANENVLVVSDMMMFGPDHLLDAYKREQPSNKLEK